MNLDEAQQKQVITWINEGLTISEIQNRLSSDFGIRLTYMDVRFLLDDLKLKPKDKDRPAKTAPELKKESAPGPAKPSGPVDSRGRPLPPAQPPPPTGGAVTVTVDQVTRPGAMVSGKVTFSDGQAADWHLDQFGRLALAAKQQGYRPSQEDLLDFQDELQSELAKLGM